MPEIIGINFTEEIRSRLCLAVGVTNWVCIIGSLMLLGIGAYIKIIIGEFTALVEDYDGDSLPYLLITVGLLSIVLNAGGGFVFFASADPKRRQLFRRVLLAYCITSIVMCILLMTGGIMCYTHITHLEDSFKGGLVKAMQKYKDVPRMKVEMDKLQMTYSCCGNAGYTGWFVLPWISEDYLNVQAAAVER